VVFRTITSQNTGCFARNGGYALEGKRYLKRSQLLNDRRHENLVLTATGTKVFEDLYHEATRFDADLMASFSAEERRALRQCLIKIAAL